MANHFPGLRGLKATDNKNVDGKLNLRRHFIQRYHTAARPAVLDCCQAGGVMWSALRREFDVKYWGVDRTPKRGRLAIDSVRLLMQPALAYDIIDVDTYGSPWRHYEALLPNLVKPTSVFLTVGKKGPGLASVDRAVQLALGLSRLSRNPPRSLLWKLDAESIAACLSRAYIYGVRIIDAQEVIPPSPNARYFGLHLIPPTTRAPSTDHRSPIT